MSSLRISPLALTVLLFVTTLGSPVAEAAEWAVGVGLFDVHDPDDRATEVFVEARTSSFRLFHLDFVPTFSLAANDDGGFWGHAGLRWNGDLAGWRISPNFAVGLYEEGDGKDLGGAIEFRSGLEISRELRPGLRLGVLYYHLSNSRIYEPNPGSESLLLTVSF